MRTETKQAVNLVAELMVENGLKSAAARGVPFAFNIVGEGCVDFVACPCGIEANAA